jgi:peptidoglycan hydrolase FlgJ
MKLSNYTSVIATHPNTSGTSARPGKIHEAAQQFEALMIGQMLKSARENGSSLDEDEGAGQDAAMEMAEAQFAGVLANSGGLGLSPVVEQSVSKQAGVQNDNDSPRTLPGASVK